MTKPINQKELDLLQVEAERVLRDLSDTTCNVTPDLRDNTINVIRSLLEALSSVPGT